MSGVEARGLAEAGFRRQADSPLAKTVGSCVFWEMNTPHGAHCWSHGFVGCAHIRSVRRLCRSACGSCKLVPVCVRICVPIRAGLCGLCPAACGVDS